MKTPRVGACRKIMAFVMHTSAVEQRATVMAGAQRDVAALPIHHERCAPTLSNFPTPTTGGQRERHDGLDVDEEFERSGWQAAKPGAEMNTNDCPHNCRTFYRPIEAAIRWSGLERFESRILEVVGARNTPGPEDFPRWPTLRLNVERILDAMRNRELPYGRAGVTCDDVSLLDDPQLSVRHVDLRAWMTRFYPSQKPAFLFDDIERQLHPTISAESIQVLLADREALRAQLATHRREIEALRKELKRQGPSERALPLRSETTYLNIIGGLLTLLLGRSPSGTPYSSFETLESVISALIAHYEGRPGISERTLWGKFAAAKRQVNAA